MRSAMLTQANDSANNQRVTDERKGMDERERSLVENRHKGRHRWGRTSGMMAKTGKPLSRHYRRTRTRREEPGAHRVKRTVKDENRVWNRMVDTVGRGAFSH
jgi:hypothetical protein